MSEDERIKLIINDKEETYSLVIKNTSISDGATYILKAKNLLGEVVTNCQLIILSPPKFTKPLSLASCTTQFDVAEVDEEQEKIKKFCINEKAQLKIESQVIGLPKPSIKWLKNENEIKIDDKIKIESKQDTHSLTIKNFSQNETGAYLIFAENEIGSAKNKIHLDINFAPVIIKPLSNIETESKENLKIELVCTFMAKPSAEVTWLFGDKLIKFDDDQSHYVMLNEKESDESGNKVSKLIINDATINDSGLYKCKLKNVAGEVITSSTVTVVKPAIIIEPLPENLDITEKKEIKLVCKIQDSAPKSTITWFKDNVLVNNSKKFVIGKPSVEESTGLTVYSLSILDSALTDAGKYTIKCTSKISTIESSCNVLIIVPPKIIKDLKPKLECVEGENIHLEVTATGKPSLEYKWYFFNIELNSEQEITPEKESFKTLNPSENVFSMDVTYIKSHMKGKYLLKLSNKAGTVETSCDLIVNVKPLIVKDLEDKQVTEKSECTFELKFEGIPTPSVEWFKNGSKLKPEPRYTIKTQGETTSLTIKDVKSPADQAKYRVVLKNKFGQIESKDASLIVSTGPCILKPLKDIEIIEHQPLELISEVTSVCKLTATWFKSDVEISQSDRIEIAAKGNNQILKIVDSVEELDSGVYRLKLENEFGVSETKSNVNILIPPRFITPLEEKTYANLGKQFELYVKLVGKPFPKIKWLKDNKELIIKDRYKVEMIPIENNDNIRECKLFIQSIQPNDNGKYTLEASNKYGTQTTQTDLIVKGEPIFVRKPADTSVMEKKSIRLECEVVGIPIPSVEWYKDDKLIENLDGVQIESKNKGLSSLIIKSMNKDLIGIYTIKAKNENGQEECKFTLNIEIAPYIIISLPEKLQAKENEPISMECSIGGSPVPKITWIRKGEDMVSSTERGINIVSDGTKQILELKTLKGEDAGVYTVVGANKAGKITCKTELVVQIAPKFLRKIVDTQVVEKKITKLEAEIQGIPKPQIIWYKNDEAIKTDERIVSHDAKGGVYQLLIKNSRKDDTGVYVCKAVNEIGEAECKANLVIEMMPQFLKKLEKLEAVESCEAVWTFQLIGIPKPNIQFTRNNQTIDLEKDKELYTLEESEDYFYHLKFTKVSPKDVGNWTCSATNTAGKASCIGRLETLPLAPPKFIKELNDCRLPHDVDNKLEVKISGLPFPKSEWFKDDQKIDFESQANKYKCEVDSYNGIVKLVVYNCQTDLDTGNYKVRIYNPGGESSSEGRVTFKGRAPKFIEKPEKVYALSNKTATFAAMVDGDPRPSVSWTKGKIQIIESDEIKIYYDDQLDVNFMEIVTSKTKDAGTYQVTASNEFGSVTEPVTLIITQNEDDVVDYKNMLKNRNYKKTGAAEEDADFGKLRKAGVREKPAEEDPEKIKLRKVEKEKKPTEEIKKEKVEVQIIYFTNFKSYTI